MPNTIIVQNVLGAPPLYQIELCEPGFLNCVIVATNLDITDFPYTITPVPPQFVDNPVQIVVTSLDPGYTGSCEPYAIITTPTPTPTQTSNPLNCFCYNITALAKTTFTITNCNGQQQTLGFNAAGDQLQVCSLTIPSGFFITFSQGPVCLSNLCPSPTPTQTQTQTRTPTNTPSNLPSQCICYNVLPFVNMTVSYVNCLGVSQILPITQAISVEFCSSTVPVLSSPGNGSITVKGNCVSNICPSPTPTPTNTPTSTVGFIPSQTPTNTQTKTQTTTPTPTLTQQSQILLNECNTGFYAPSAFQNGIVTINGVTVETTFVGDVIQGPAIGGFLACLPPDSFYLATPMNIWMGSLNNYRLTLTFNPIVNNVLLMVTGGGVVDQPGVFETMRITTNTGTPTITKIIGCNDFVSGNDIGQTCNTTDISQNYYLCGHGVYKITNVNPYNSMTIRGNGGMAGVNIALCLSGI